MERENNELMNERRKMEIEIKESTVKIRQNEITVNRKIRM